MKYYVLMIIRFNDGTADKSSVYSFDDKDSALASYYKNLGIYVNQKNVDHVLGNAFDMYGGCLEIKSWTREN